ncbi:type II toxin-antitoxin system PemK/MazF family toxin [Persephonella atlantica]|uniref:mRNA interferase n=1 Tax=Persephonella atlantica TaxID=2699429 RepID=A0ABS1GH67_9AQUI|nr:type II toxin-antitoxin system PemK/MazF family toxin [Persephonella atlantica]MBK3332259.1 type II toxin-antitoxin system PemK/MazF family toxin [Persephonella atlantica]
MNKGEIYLAKLNSTKGSEISKVRPVIIFQSPYLKDLPTVIVIPLTTHLKDNWFPLRVRISKRGKLEKDSDAVIEQIRAIDKSRIIGNPIASLSQEEIELVEEAVLFVLGIK